MITAEHVRRAEDWPVYWFVKLEQAVERGDHQAAADIQRELERLGVVVRYGRPAPPQLAVLWGDAPDA